MNTVEFPPVGAIVSFGATPDSMALGLPQAEGSGPFPVFIGRVVKAVPLYHLRGKIPSAAVSVKGLRTGKVVVIDGAGCYLKIHGTVEEAQERKQVVPC